MRKAQGSLEYLIIVAAVLAIAAVVVLFLSGAFKGANAPTPTCKNVAAQCAVLKQTTANYNCTSGCITACTGTDGKDVMNKTVIPAIGTCVSTSNGSACGYCADGNAAMIG